MKIYLLLAHPDVNSFNGSLADAYEREARLRGHEVRRQDLGMLNFDPVLRHGYKQVQPLEPDLEMAREHLIWCNHWVIVYPVWWGSVPALLKGFLDRVLLPSFAFRYHEQGPFWDKLLKGKSALLMSTSDAPALWLWWQYRNSDINMMKQAVLKFCGFKPVKYVRIGRLKYLDARQRKEKADSIIQNAFK